MSNSDIEMSDTENDAEMDDIMLNAMPEKPKEINPANLPW